jgi:hypothetical protein
MMMQRFKVALAMTVALAIPAIAHGQKTTPPVRRRQAPIEIRGQVPTPQVVTVRPREVPTYSRQVLYPRFYDHDFWPAILPAYQIVSKRQVTGMVPVDSATIRADSAATSTFRGTTPVAPAPADSVRQSPPATRPDSAAHPSGTPPARTSR